MPLIGAKQQGQVNNRLFLRDLRDEAIFIQG